MTVINSQDMFVFKMTYKTHWAIFNMCITIMKNMLDDPIRNELNLSLVSCDLEED